MEEDPTCCMCMELFTDPVSLPCDHSFCRRCLKSLLIAKSDERGALSGAVSIPCPLCRAEVRVSSDDVDKLPPRQDLIELLARKFEATVGFTKPPAVGECRNHRKPLALFCATCQLSICTECIPDHEGHVMNSIKSAFDKHKATVEANNLAAVANAMTLYTKLMKEVCGGDKPYLHPEYMQKEHKKSSENAVDTFRSSRKMGGPEFSQAFEEKLREEMLEAFDRFQKHNERKNILSTARTPAVLYTMMVVTYLVSGVFGSVFLILLVSWLYVRYSGEYRELGVHIDRLADTLWDKAISPVYTAALPQGAQHAIATAISTLAKKRN